ncbi:putative glutathione-specific gamma-glutamylcyclotransferase 2 [Ananas comosus]|uniref:glutathione-specific gamma-glutamylcyclotransferase n=1 Tax=Ananas comosus TaxID=4615 RepID=A0A199VPL1_ANACO|nr:putative glutathione-specific gamma-glutamylcyclotransferase 2 [Ananas comosus]
MAMWVFGYGSLIWKPGFPYDEKLLGFIRGYRRGARITEAPLLFPGERLRWSPSAAKFWGVAYKVSKEEDKKIALEHLEVREKQYDKTLHLDFFTDPTSATPTVCDTRTNMNYLGPAPLEDIARQIVQAAGPSGPNRDYLFHLEDALNTLGCEDAHVRDLANAVRRILSAESTC